METTTQQRCPTPGCDNPRGEEWPGTCERHTQQRMPWEPCPNCGREDCRDNGCQEGK